MIICRIPVSKETNKFIEYDNHLNVYRVCSSIEIWLDTNCTEQWSLCFDRFGYFLIFKNIQDKLLFRLAWT